MCFYVLPCAFSNFLRLFQALSLASGFSHYTVGFVQLQVALLICRWLYGFADGFTIIGLFSSLAHMWVDSLTCRWLCAQVGGFGHLQVAMRTCKWFPNHWGGFKLSTNEGGLLTWGWLCLQRDDFSYLHGALPSWGWLCALAGGFPTIGVALLNWRWQVCFVNMFCLLLHNVLCF